MHFIQEIFQGDQNQDYIHRKFIRYSRGEFKGPAVGMKNPGGLLKIHASEEYVNLLGSILAGNSHQNLDFSGDIISRDDVGGFLSTLGIQVKKSTKKKGVFTLKVDGSIQAENLMHIYSKLTGSYIFLDLNSTENKSSIKTKKKPPKPGSEPDQNFCSAVFDASLTNAVLDEICFDVDIKDFGEIRISHKYVIKELLIPEEYRENFALARVHAKRKGVIERIIEVDGERKEIQKEFIL
jgi:hypothetical protein